MTPIATDAAPAAIGPYAQAIAVDDWIFTSGQLPLTLSGDIPAGFEAQAEQVFDNLAAVLREAGTSLHQVVKATVFVTDLGDFTKLNAIYAKRFGAHNLRMRLSAGCRRSCRASNEPLTMTSSPSSTKPSSAICSMPRATSGK
jgi:2-iminobutanoate/2-iminopropanoate deaminase